jgi:glyoxylase-like metal-dependent hydrolase (beta-lactamase superfamily II)
MTETKTAHYTIEDLGNGIHAALARPDGFAVCNSGLVDLGEGGVVFDTGLTPDSARDLKSSAELVLGRSPSLCVISHRHLDHALGNSEFPGIPIWGTRRAREVILETRDQTMAELKREQLEKDIGELESRRPEMKSEAAVKDLDFILLMNRALLASAGRLQLIPPDQTFETRVSLPGRRGAEFVSFGSGHTEADAIMFLPQEKVLFAGDLVCLGIQPSMGNGDPEHWLTVLDEIERLRPEQIVPGHGPVTTVEGLEEVRGYLTGVLRAAGASKGAKLPAAIRRWEGTLSLEENVKFARGWLAAHRSRR